MTLGSFTITQATTTKQLWPPKHLSHIISYLFCFFLATLLVFISISLLSFNHRHLTKLSELLLPATFLLSCANCKCTYPSSSCFWKQVIVTSWYPQAQLSYSIKRLLQACILKIQGKSHQGFSQPYSITYLLFFQLYKKPKKIEKRVPMLR